MKNQTKKYFNTIDITSLEVLSKKLFLLLDGYKIKNGDIYEYAIILKNIHKLGSLDKILEQSIDGDYPEILKIKKVFKGDLSTTLSFITDSKIILGDSYSVEELSNLILNHNKLVIEYYIKYKLNLSRLIFQLQKV